MIFDTWKFFDILYTQVKQLRDLKRRVQIIQGDNPALFKAIF